MELLSYRLVQKRHAQTAFDGEGARLYAGRWNSKGISVAYTSDSLALCCLEIFVHLPSYSLLQNYLYFHARFDDSLVLDVELEHGWESKPLSAVSQAIGDEWYDEQSSPVLRVPTAIIPEGFNYIFNVRHPDFDQVKLSRPQLMDFDPRLK